MFCSEHTANGDIGSLYFLEAFEQRLRGARLSRTVREADGRARALRYSHQFGPFVAREMRQFDPPIRAPLDCLTQAFEAE